MGYSDPNVLYPDFDNVRADDGIVAEWFYDAYRSNKNSAEIFAIVQYTGQASMYAEIGQLLMGISLTEMKHYDKLSDFINTLGGTINLPFNTTVVKYGETPREALQLALEGEIATIKEYTKLVDKISKLELTATATIALQLLAKLIADEEVHKTLLQEKLNELNE